MKWVSHISIGVCVCVPISPLYVPFVIVGSIAPDVLESVFKVKHRTQGHYFLIWLLLVLGTWSIPIIGIATFWFSVGGFLHVFADSMTIQGVPLYWNSSHYFHLLKAPFKTGSQQEFMFVGMLIIITFLLVSKISYSSQYIPFFYDWYQYYSEGILDASELKRNRLNFF